MEKQVQEWYPGCMLRSKKNNPSQYFFALFNYKDLIFCVSYKFYLYYKVYKCVSFSKDDMIFLQIPFQMALLQIFKYMIFLLYYCFLFFIPLNIFVETNTMKEWCHEQYSNISKCAKNVSII